MTAVVRPPLEQDPHEVAERRSAARFLLMHPLVVAPGPHAEQLRLIRRHEAALTELFSRGLGYRLRVDASSARLMKAGLGDDPHRGLRRRTAAATPFTPRGYAFFTLVVAALTRTRNQLLIDELVRQVRSVAVDAGLDVDLDTPRDRRALHAAILELVHLQVISERDGDLEHWVEQAGATSLLDVRRDLLSLLVAAPLSAARSPADLLRSSALPSAAGGARVAVRRRLLESPVLSVADLDEDQREWWSRNRNREREWFADAFGLELELRAEGAVAVDPDEELSDEEFPGRGGTRHLALLALDLLANRVRVATSRDGGEADPGEGSSHDDESGAPWRRLTPAEVQSDLVGTVSRWSAGLRRDQREDPDRAVEHALVLLERMGVLMRRHDWWVHPAAARYAATPVLTEASSSGEASLFDGLDLDGTDADRRDHDDRDSR